MDKKTLMDAFEAVLDMNERLLAAGVDKRTRVVFDHSGTLSTTVAFFNPNHVDEKDQTQFVCYASCSDEKKLIDAVQKCSFEVEKEIQNGPTKTSDD